jgi:DNA-binding NtrC family response regulator
VLFVVLDAGQPRAGGLRLGLANLTRVEIGRGPERQLERPAPDERVLRLPDRNVSTAHARLSRRQGLWTVEDCASKNGTLVNGEQLVAPRELQDGDVIRVGLNFLLFRENLAGSLAAPDRVAVDLGDPAAATLLPAWETELGRLDAVARSSVPVLLHGESGTGKELLAARVHRLSGRRGPLVAVNCAGLSDGLVQSELFGHLKGAFTGAESDAPGLVRSADRGTLFLDEIGDMAARAQAAILRVLQEQVVTPVGATRPIPVDLRVVAATHRDLAQAVGAGSFREDLLARLSGFVLELPPVRERREDVGVLIGAVLGRSGPEGDAVRLEADAAEALLEHDWPRNVRELQQALRSALALAVGRPIRLEDLPSVLAGPARSAGSDTPGRGPTPELKAELDARLREHRGNVTRVAQEMGKPRPQVHRWLRQLGLSANRYRP